MKNIIRNSIRTPDGTEIISTSVHDFVEYTDENGQYYAVDGGNSYLKRNYDEPDYQETSIYDDDAFDVIREAFKWGTYGPNGDQPLQRKPLSTLDDDHIVAILETQTHLPQHIRDLFKKEQDYRKDN